MANPMPEVVPEVLSMPTTGWFCRTGGSARNRVTPNTAVLDSGGMYHVKGVPGHTHNASAVVSVDADYTKYRKSRLQVPPNVWAHGALDLPVGLLTDSEEPDNADERYDRAIERCVGYISMFPENCTGHIMEPTRSIGEIRTLVAPKARLNTLTYIDELRGWRVPQDATDEKAGERDPLVSEFPDVYVSVCPTTQVQTATRTLANAPGSLYLDTTAVNERYRIDTAANDIARASGTIATLPGDLPWDGTLRFVWDPDRRLYKMLNEFTVVLHSVTRVVQANGIAVANVAVYDGQIGVGHAPKLTVTFPVLQTTQAFDGSCWLAAMRNEEALNYATRGNGPSLIPDITVDVIGAATHGPFKWIGMPCCRIPVGSAYALPGPDILQENIGDGDATDVQYNFYDKFDAFTQNAEGEAAVAAQQAIVDAVPPGGAAGLAAAQAKLEDLQRLAIDGFLRHHYRYEEALRLHLAAGNAAAADGTGGTEISRSMFGAEAFDIAARSVHRNSGMFYKRSGGTEGALTASHPAVQPAFTARFRPYRDQFVANNLPTGPVITTGIRSALYARNKPDDLEEEFEDASDDAEVNRNVSRAALVAAKSLVARLRVSGSLEQRAIADAALVDAQALNDHREAEHIRLDDLHTLATANAAEQFLSPFTYKDNSTQYSELSLFSSSVAFSFKGQCTVSFPADPFAGAPVADMREYQFVRLPVTPLLFQIQYGGANSGKGQYWDGDAKFIGNEAPLAIMNVKSLSAAARSVTCAFDFENVMSTGRGMGNVNTLAPFYVAGGAALADTFFTAGFSFFLGRGEGIDSNLLASYFANANLGVDAQTLRNIWKDRFDVGNKFPVENRRWTFTVAAGKAYIYVRDTIFAMESDLGGLYFESAAALDMGDGNQRKFCMFAPATRPRAQVHYTADGGGAYQLGRLVSEPIGPLYKWDQDAGTCALVSNAELTALQGAAQPDNSFNGQDLNMYMLDADWHQAHIGDNPYAEVRAASLGRGAIFQSIKRISQHLCAPILNPNLRIGAIAPLNHDSRFLPPELRDFRLQLHEIDWGRLQATKSTLNELTLYEFKGGNQRVGAEQNVLYLPQFREFKRPIAGNTFEVEVFSELGSPAYFCVFCRSATTDILQQPIIKTLSVYNNTTKKKSNTVTEMTVSQLYHLTQRNVHPFAEYDRKTFTRRQTVLLSAEDVGLLGLKADEYQKAKRVRYVFSGTTDEPGQLYIVLIYNNRGLHIDGRRLQVVTLHE